MTGEDHSFVVCAYGESRYLEECVKSLLSQTVRSRIVIATSTPGEWISSLAEKYDICLTKNTVKKGIGSDWNFAFDSTATALVTIAHQDDVYDMKYTEEMLTYLNASRDPILFFSDYKEIRNKHIAEAPKILKIKRGMLFPLRVKAFRNSRFVRRRILSLGSPICCPSVTYVREKVGSSPFSTSLKCDLDWDQWERLSRKKGAFVYCPKQLVLHRIHRESETSKLIGDNTRTKEDIEILDRFWPKPIALLVERFYKKSQDSNRENTE